MSLPDDYAGRLGGLLLDPADSVRMSAAGKVNAAVLVPLYVQEGELTAVFTKRPADMRRHAGEISFPGGRQDPGEELRDTALREAEEEIGLMRDLVDVVGALPPTGTFVTNYVIYPFVGITAPGGAFRPNPIEVDEIVELSLPDLIAGYEHKRLIRRGVPIKTDRILAGLLERLKPIL
jgi:8-oxo-dGTP pyrophosphatase MutT (NUDIX family)